MSTFPAVLYVEDDPLSRRILETLLVRRLKLSHVTFFVDSTDFDMKVHELNPKPDVIFLDINVEPYDGYEMLKMLRQSEKFNSVPVIALTASIMSEEVQRLRAAGFQGLIGKPVNLHTFPTLLNSILKGEAVWRVLD